MRCVATTSGADRGIAAIGPTTEAMAIQLARLKSRTSGVSSALCSSCRSGRPRQGRRTPRPPPATTHAGPTETPHDDPQARQPAPGERAT